MISLPFLRLATFGARRVLSPSAASFSRGGCVSPAAISLRSAGSRVLGLVALSFLLVSELLAGWAVPPNAVADSQTQYSFSWIGSIPSYSAEMQIQSPSGSSWSGIGGGGGSPGSNITIGGTYAFSAQGTWKLRIYADSGSVVDSTTVDVGSAIRPQTITLTNPGTRTVGQAFDVVAVASSGLPVTIVVDSGSATLAANGRTLTPTAAGTVSIRATQAGNASYTPAAEACAFLVVAPSDGTSAGPGLSQDPAPVLPPGQQLVATLPGDFSVDNKGSANYSVPLSVPAGRSGMAPKLSLNYSSAAGNGPLGLGFSLSTGFPQAITRGRTILARDGETRGVVFDNAKDKLYLDGKRLICVSGTYGSPGSTYRTEVDSFVSIAATGSGANIDTFVVTDKSGSKMTFGKYSTATDGYQAGYVLEVIGDPPRYVTGPNGVLTYVPGTQTVINRKDTLANAWALKCVEDVVGNRVTLTYGDSAGEYPLTTIEYTSNSLTNIAPAHRVRLLYNQNPVEGDTARRDRATHYIAGRSFAFRARLDQIVAETATTAGPNTLMSLYELGYEYAPDNGPTRLRELKASFRSPDAAELRPVDPTVFTWEDKTAAYTTVAAGTLTDPMVGTGSSRSVLWDGGTKDLHAFADVDGDGRDEFIDFRTPGAIMVSRFAGSAYGTPQNWIAAAGLWTGTRNVTRMCDVNGDGLKDIVFVSFPELKLYALVSDGNSFKPLGGGTQLTAFYTLSDLEEFADPATTQGRGNILGLELDACLQRISIADFSGDGRDDVLIHRYDGQLQVLRSEGTSFTKLPLVNVGASRLDGHASYEFPGVRFLGYVITNNFSVSPMPCDLNGDGLIDYVWTETRQNWNELSVFGSSVTSVQGTKTVYAVTSLPSGGFSPRTDVSGTGWGWSDLYPGSHRSNAFVLMPGDVNGDGLTDLTIMMRAEEDSASRYNDGRYPADRQCLLRMQTYLSKGSSGIPNFAGVDMMSGQTNDCAQVQLEGVWANPWFDKIFLTYWSEFYSQPARAAPPQRPLILASALTGGGDNMSMTDVNGDGKADYVWYLERFANNEGSSRDGWWVMYSQGGRFSAPVRLDATKLGWKQSPTWAPGIYHPTVVTRSGLDLNGDGLTDYAYFEGCYEDKPGVQGFHISSGSQGLRLKTIEDGLGRKTDITYKPITDDSVYTKGAAVTYPIRELRNATYVVSDLKKDTGSTIVADRAHFSYQYSGNRLDLSGRGGLGFHSFITLDRQTNLFKYQFLAQSFPMTGLTAREQTYRYWEDGAIAKFRLINSHDNTVVFDEVVKSATDANPWGTVYPFISQAIEYRWEDAAASHFSFNKATSPDSKSAELFTKARPAGHHIAISAASLFDKQAAVQTTIPGGKFNASDRSTDWASEGANTVYGSTSYQISGLGLPRKITYGNLTRLSTDFGDGFTETVSTEYFGPSEVGGLTGLAKNVTTTTGSIGYGTETAPIKRYTYWKNGATWTPFVATESVDANRDGDFDDSLDLVTTSHRGELAESIQRPWVVTRTSIAGYNANANSAVLGSVDTAAHEQHVGSFTTGKVTALDLKWDLPTKTENTYAHTTTTAYHSLLGLPVSVKDVNNAEVTTTYDALGRKLVVRDVLKDLTTTYAYEWVLATSPNAWARPFDNPVSGPSSFTGAGTGVTGVSAVPGVPKYAIRTTATVQAPVTAYYDRLGRVIRTVKEGFNGQQTYTDTVYNTLGQTIAVSLPYDPNKSATGPFWTTTTYDALGRVVTVTAPNGTVTTNTYAGRTTTVSVKAPDRPAQSNATLVDAKGRTIKVWNADPISGLADTAATASIQYVLDGFGRMRETVLKDQTQTIKATYDALGRQTGLDDPDKGPWTYVNNALGHVVKQTDAKGTITRSTFDRLGRPLSRRTVEAAGPVETADWYYYCTATEDALHRVGFTTQGWIGAPQRSTSQTNGAPGYGDPGTASIQYYNAKGLPHLNLNLADGKYFYTAHEYDTYSRPAKVSYFWRPAGHEDAQNPAGTGTPSATPYYWQDWGYTYTYDGTGAASKSYLLTMADTAGRTWWQADSAAGYDHLDRPVKVRKGDGHWTVRTYRPTDGLLTGLASGPTAGSTAIQNLSFDYDGLGNLKQRKNDAISATEDLTYDNLNRLNSGGVAYAANGNITTKKGVDGTDGGTYTYAAKVIIGGVERTLPHAVSSAFGNTYTYDANGNLLTRTGSGGTWSTRWAGFDKPRWLINATTGKGDEFTYNANRSRVVHLSIDAVNGTDSAATPKHYSRKKVYGLGPQLEVDYSNASGVGVPPAWSLQKLRIYVPGPEGTAGTMEFNPQQSFDNAESALVYHYDHLGSIERITPHGSTSTTYVLDGQGKPSRYSYDAWGQRRNADTWSGAPTTTADGGSDDATPRGYTGHEMLDDLGLVHMNGRIYDPLLGRFLSADLLITNPGNLQTYNRYSYVNNNPLTLVDPSGFDPETPEQQEAREKAEREARIKEKIAALEEARAKEDANRKAAAEEAERRANEQSKPSVIDQALAKAHKDRLDAEGITEREIRPLEGGPAIPGSGGPGGTKQEGPIDTAQNCGGASLGIEGGVHWPGTGRDGSLREATHTTPDGMTRVENDGSTTTTTRARPGEREVIVWVWEYKNPETGTRGVQFHMIGRTTDSAGPWNSKNGYEGARVGQITNPDKALVSYNSEVAYSRSAVKMTFVVRDKEIRIDSSGMLQGKTRK